MDLTGHNYGFWTVLEYAGKPYNNKQRYWRCQCACGKVQNVAAKHLRNGKSKSCRCKRKLLHDDSGSNHWSWLGGQKNPGSMAWCKVRLRSLVDAQRRRGGAEIVSTPEEVLALWEESLGKCVACGVMPNEIRSLFLDHGRWTGRVRGFICSGCNTALGMVGESPERLRALASYIERTGASVEPRVA